MLLVLRSLFETHKVSASIQGVSSTSSVVGIKSFPFIRIPAVSSYSTAISAKVKLNLVIPSNYISGIMQDIDIFGRESHLHHVSSHLTISRPSVFLSKVAPILVSEISTVIIFSWNISRDTINTEVIVKDSPIKTILTNRHNVTNLSVINKEESTPITDRTRAVDITFKDQPKSSVLSDKLSVTSVSIKDNSSIVTIVDRPNSITLIQNNSDNINLATKSAQAIYIINKPDTSDIIVSNKTKI